MDNVGVCFHFENNERDMWSGRSIDLDLWRLPGKAQNISKYAIIDLSDCRYRWSDSEVTLEEYDNLASFEAGHVADNIVYLEHGSAFDGLTDMIHYNLQDYPFDFNVMTWFVIGPAGGFVPTSGDGKTWATIPQLNNQVTKFGFQVGSALMDYVAYRYAKDVLGLYA